MQGVMRALLALVALAFISAACVAPVYSQSTEQSAPAVKIDKRKLLVQPRNADGSVQEVSIFEDPVLWARDKQQNFYRQMSGALRQMTSGSPLAAAWTLMLLSFAYGVFHAAGPGHGKAVISAWLLATENELRRGVLISAMSAIVQALTAIVLVSALFLIVASVGSTARNVAGILESASSGMIALLGLYLVWTAVKSLLPRPSLIAAPAIAGTGARQAIQLHAFETFTPMKSDDVAPGHIHGPDCGCGHAHVPEAKDLRGDWSLAKAFSLAFAVGIRPCTGAILVLVFANGIGLYWAGVASTFAMALGTFITVSVIAALAVYSKKLAVKLASKNDRWLNWLGLGLRFGGGLAIAFLGTILFLGSLGTTSGMM
jgi:nickel/cobalt exporter